MDAAELRIGSIVDLWGSVAHIHKCDFSENEYGIGVDEAKPIPITEKWLSDFGFNKFEGLFVKTKKGGQQIFIEVTGTGKFCFKYAAFVCYLYSVHELQNLYYSIMKEELIIT